MVTITVKKEEYLRLKKLEKSFGKLFNYFRHLYEISEARKEIKEKRIISQDKLFKKLGL
mgnify:CR=1 FL=1